MFVSLDNYQFRLSDTRGHRPQTMWGRSELQKDVAFLAELLLINSVEKDRSTARFVLCLSKLFKAPPLLSFTFFM